MRLVAGVKRKVAKTEVNGGRRWDKSRRQAEPCHNRHTLCCNFHSFNATNVLEPNFVD